jgi:predicted Rossmann fold nucleotide-binding protein DprA/Smf involved in DNA uptake
MRVAIVGHRDYTNYGHFRKIMKDWASKYGLPNMIISGGARGVDTLAEKYAREKQIPIMIWHARWRRYGRAAGPRRNAKIVGACDHVVAFLHPKSRGTKNTIEIAEKEGKPTTIINLPSATGDK